MLWIEDLPSLMQLNIKGLKKLRTVHEMGESQSVELAVHECIRDTQQHSHNVINVYESMTFTDIDLVLNVINLGAKVAAEMNLIEDYSDPFNFEIRLLSPLQEIDTQGTGEIYSYELLAGHKEPDNSFSVSFSEGHHNQEACLVRSLEFLIDFLEVPNNKHPSADDMLDYLYHLSNRGNNIRQG